MWRLGPSRRFSRSSDGLEVADEHSRLQVQAVICDEDAHPPRRRCLAVGPRSPPGSPLLPDSAQGGPSQGSAATGPPSR